MAPKAGSEVVSVGGRRLTLTNLDKVLYPETGTTKRDVIEYYATIGETMIAHTANRPATRKRWVHGVGTPSRPGEVFFQKNLDESAPDWVHRAKVTHKTHTNEYPLVNDLPTLVWLAQIASLEIHVPQWQVGANGQPKNPDQLVLDLDPGDGVGLRECAEVAGYARGILTGMGLEPMPVTSGSKGIHLYAALDGSQNSERISAVAHELARALEADHPDLVVSDMKKSLRRGKVLVDWSQNNAAKTTIAPYSLRGRFRPTVAAPRTWRELASSSLDHLDYHEVLARVKRRGDPLSSLRAGAITGPNASEDRLSTYRGMRHKSRTPEPVPDRTSGDAAGRSFVIQEHHARRLHWDFRLQHGGVLVSWALPKGTPTDTGKNHLAVQTEDHPLEYGSFQGHIPEGEYGGGDVTIWDSGTYELEKWRDGKEVIATLYPDGPGGLGGPRKFALIHTGGEGKAERNWLIHLMKDSPGIAEPKADTRPRSLSRSSRHHSLPAAVSPMLATLGSVADIHDEDEWAFEMKWDGVRAIATVADGAVRFTSRNGKDSTATYPDLAELSDLVGAHSAVLDGEVVALASGGRPDFSRLQQRMGLTKPGDVEHAMAVTPVHLMLFDLLELDGKPLLKQPYDARRDALKSLISPGKTSRIQVPPAFAGSLEEAIERSRSLGLEGVMAKERSGTYSAGRRSRTWIKIKLHSTQEVIVAGWRPGNGRRADTVGSLVLGVPENGELRYVGRVGTGFSDRDLDDLTKKLAARARTRPSVTEIPAADARGVHWVRPDLVGEVEFSEWTAGGRLRQPSWRGLRADKRPDEVIRE